jgi:hypothetical protein
MPDGTGTFDGLFHQMELDIKRARETSGGGASAAAKYDEYGSARSMRTEEKRISFYNRYFIFRKNRSINAKQLKNSFLSYAGLQEEQERAESGKLDEDTERIALEKINRASMPIDVATKPAIAAELLKKKENEKLQKQLNESLAPAASAASAADSSQRKLTVKARTAKQKEHDEAVATYRKENTTYKALMAELGMESSAPIEQIEKNIKKRTRKAGFDPETGKEYIDFEMLSGVAEKGMANPLQPPKTTTLKVRKTKPTSGAVAGAGTGNENKESATPKKSRKKKDE